MATLSIIQPCSDVSDIIPLFPQQGLYLKPIARLNISVHLPTLKLSGKTISNYEVMEKLKYWTIPDEFTSLKVSKNTLEFIRFEAEIESRSKLSAVLARLDGRFIKLSGFSESLKVRAAEAKCDFPTRHNWDSYFRDAKNMNEMKPGERPDTIHITNLPCKWFANKSNPDKPNEYIFRKVFETFGEVRCIDIPLIDPYRSRMKAHISGIKMFSYHQNVVFEGYIQFKEYVYFMKAMDTLRGMKLIYKEDTNIFSASIKIDFDKTKHLSDTSIKKRRNERDKMMAEEREREEQERLKKEKEEATKEAEKNQKLKEKEEKLSRRKQREEKRKLKQLTKLKVKEAEEMNRKIASEERLLLMAQRRLESIRLLSELFKRVEESTLKKIEERKELEKLMKKDKGKKGSKGSGIELMLLADNEEKELRQKLVEKFKSTDNKKSKTKKVSLPGSSKTAHVASSSVSGAVPVSSSDDDDDDDDDDVASLITSSESEMSENDVKTKGNNEGLPPYSNNYRGMARIGGMGWYPHTRTAMTYNPYPVISNAVSRPHRPYFPRGRRGYRWPRYQGRGRGGYIPSPYIDPLLLDINHQYYKYFHKLTHNRTSRSSSRSYSYSRSRSHSRTRNRSHSRGYSRSGSSSWSHSRSRTHSRTRSRSPGHSRSRRRSDKNYSRSKSNHSRKSKSRSNHRSRSRNSDHDSSRRSLSRRRTKSHSRDRQHHQKNDSKNKSSQLSSESKDDKINKRKSRWDSHTTSDNKSDSKSKRKDVGVDEAQEKDDKKGELFDKSDLKKSDGSRNFECIKSPVRFPSVAHTWSRSPSRSSSLSWEKNKSKENKNKKTVDLGESFSNKSIIKNESKELHKKDRKKHKKKKKQKVKEKL